MIFALAARNGVQLAFPTVDALRDAYRFTDLQQSFLNLYYQGMVGAAERLPGLFHEITAAYLKRASAQGVPPTRSCSSTRRRTSTRGIAFSDTVIDGLWNALREGANAPSGSRATSSCAFLRDLSAESAMATARGGAGTYRDRIVAVGLDSAGDGQPAEQVHRRFRPRARRRILNRRARRRRGPAPQYIVEALDLLQDIARRSRRAQHRGSRARSAQLVNRDRRSAHGLPAFQRSPPRSVDKLSDHPLRGTAVDVGLGRHLQLRRPGILRRLRRR